ELQTQVLLEKLTTIVQHHGGEGVTSLVKITVFLTDMAYWDTVNTIFADRLLSHKTARSMVCVQTIHKGYQVMMDAVAYLGH
ncbi:MAG: RidA family protein, partial [Vampirovibrionales bacterium]